MQVYPLMHRFRTTFEFDFLFLFFHRQHGLRSRFSSQLKSWLPLFFHVTISVDPLKPPIVVPCGAEEQASSSASSSSTSTDGMLFAVCCLLSSPRCFFYHAWFLAF